MLFDSHCHLDFPEFHADRAQAIERARRVGVSDVFVAGVTTGQWSRLVALRDAHLEVSIGFGLHPWYLNREASVEQAMQRLRDAWQRHAPSALGEFGLDRLAEGRRDVAWKLQCEYFEAQLALAANLKAPVVLHIVRAHSEALGILSTRRSTLPCGVVHGFTGSLEQARAYTELGLRIGIGPAVLQSPRVQRVARELEPGALLLETDAPDQSPAGRSVRHECADLLAIANAVAELRGVAVEELGALTTANARRLFGTRARWDEPTIPSE